LSALAPYAAQAERLIQLAQYITQRSF